MRADVIQTDRVYRCHSDRQGIPVSFKQTGYTGVIQTDRVCWCDSDRQGVLV